jgi:large subunit ribosomal protein L30
MAKVIVIQTGSRSGCTQRQRKTLDALGLKKMNQKVEHEATPQIMGMIRKVLHLVKSEQL